MFTGFKISLLLMIISSSLLSKNITDSLGLKQGLWMRKLQYGTVILQKL